MKDVYTLHSEAKSNPSAKLGCCIIAVECINACTTLCVLCVTVLSTAQLHTGQFSNAPITVRLKAHCTVISLVLSTYPQVKNVSELNDVQYCTRMNEYH